MPATLLQILCSSWSLIRQLVSEIGRFRLSGCEPGGDHFVPCDRDGVKEGLHWGLSEAPSALMGPLLVVAPDPGVEIALQFVGEIGFTRQHEDWPRPVETWIAIYKSDGVADRWRGL
jgi:hypothetical protein